MPPALPFTDQECWGHARRIYAELPVFERQPDRLGLVSPYEPVFREAVTLLIHAFMYMNRRAIYEDERVAAGTLLAATNLDHLWTGWQAFLSGLDSVAVTLLRRTFEGRMYQIALSHDRDLAQKWFSKGFKPGDLKRDVFPVVAAALESVDKGLGDEMIEKWKKEWDFVNDLAHANANPSKLAIYSGDITGPGVSFGGRSPAVPERVVALAVKYKDYARQQVLAVEFSFRNELKGTNTWVTENQAEVAKAFRTSVIE